MADAEVVDFESDEYQPVHYDGDQSWMEFGLCAQTDPALFFPEGKGGHDGSKAKGICRRCDVRATCRKWSIDTHQEFGIWGGLSHRERQTIFGKIERGEPID